MVHSPIISLSPLLCLDTWQIGQILPVLSQPHTHMSSRPAFQRHGQQGSNRVLQTGKETPIMVRRYVQKWKARKTWQAPILNYSIFFFMVRKCAPEHKSCAHVPILSLEYSGIHTNLEKKGGRNLVHSSFFAPGPSHPTDNASWPWHGRIDIISHHNSTHAQISLPWSRMRSHQLHTAPSGAFLVLFDKRGHKKGAFFWANILFTQVPWRLAHSFC
jgi:hypothetical protein